MHLNHCFSSRIDDLSCGYASRHSPWRLCSISSLRESKSHLSVVTVNELGTATSPSTNILITHYVHALCSYCVIRCYVYCVKLIPQSLSDHHCTLLKSNATSKANARDKEIIIAIIINRLNVLSSQVYVRARK